MKEMALGALCLAGMIALSGCSAGSSSGVLPNGAANGQSNLVRTESPTDVFVPIFDSVGVTTNIVPSAKVKLTH
ncbi:MAG: hypothetical protein ACLPSH_13350 [Vulcanimicrobiaceae bacterium]